MCSVYSVDFKRVLQLPPMKPRCRPGAPEGRILKIEGLFLGNAAWNGTNGCFFEKTLENGLDKCDISRRPTLGGGTIHPARDASGCGGVSSIVLTAQSPGLLRG